MSNKPIYVTQPYLPPLEEFVPYLQQIWDNKILTNGGPMHQQLEQALSAYLGVPEVALFNNGTSALITALQVLGISGEVITTPYSFVATSHSLLWNGLTPVFVDIEPNSMNLDPSKIEAAITSRTSAILAVHCYGNPCDVNAIQAIADRNNLKVIYDAAHAFGVKDDKGSILRYGDLSVLSFHATKVFNTFEGGAIICHDKETKAHIDQLKNFGIVDEVTVNGVGSNGKMSEFNAAFGLLQLHHIERIIDRRKEIDATYRAALGNIEGISLVSCKSQVVHNYSYFPIIVEQNYPICRDTLYEKLKEKNIFARRYFYPLISDFPIYQDNTSILQNDLAVAADLAQKVLCLPIYVGLLEAKIIEISRLIKNNGDYL